MIVDQSPEGLEVLRGSSTYTYDGNWKVQAENGADGYHVACDALELRAPPPSRRATGESVTETKAMDAGQLGQAAAAVSTPSTHGHVLLWTTGPTPRTGRCRAPRRAGSSNSAQASADWMLSNVAQPVPLPERLPDGPVQLADPAFPADRGGPDRGHHLLHRPQGRERARRAPRGSASTRTSSTPPAWPRPDDLEEFRSCQNDLPAAPAAPWNDMSRGADALDRGPGRRRQGARARTRLRSGVQAPRTRASTRSSTATG